MRGGSRGGDRRRVVGDGGGGGGAVAIRKSLEENRDSSNHSAAIHNASQVTPHLSQRGAEEGRGERKSSTGPPPPLSPNTPPPLFAQARADNHHLSHPRARDLMDKPWTKAIKKACQISMNGPQRCHVVEMRRPN